MNPFEDYRDLTEKQAKDLYTRLYRKAKGRIQRAEKAGRGSFSTIRKYKKELVPYSKVKNIYRELARIEHFLSLETSTAKGIKAVNKRVTESLQEKGYSFVNERNIDEFNEFMSYYSDLMKAGLYPSSAIANLFHTQTIAEISLEDLQRDFELYAKKQEDIEEYFKSKGKDIHSISSKEFLKQWRKK